MNLNNNITCTLFHQYDKTSGDILTLKVKNQLNFDIQIGGWVHLNPQYCSEILSLTGPTPHSCGATAHVTSYPKTVIEAQSTFTSTYLLVDLCNFYRERVLPGLYTVSVQKGAIIHNPHADKIKGEKDLLGHSKLDCTTTFYVSQEQNLELTVSGGSLDEKPEL